MRFLNLWVETGIVELRLERPEVKNAINWEAMRLLRGVVEKVEADDTVKVVLVTSSVPGVFCAGADLKVSVYSTTWKCKHVFSYFIF